MVTEGVQYSRLRARGAVLVLFWRVGEIFTIFGQNSVRFCVFLAKLSAVLRFLAKFSAVLRFSYPYGTPLITALLNLKFIVS